MGLTLYLRVFSLYSVSPEVRGVPFWRNGRTSDIFPTNSSEIHASRETMQALGKSSSRTAGHFKKIGVRACMVVGSIGRIPVCIECDRARWPLLLLLREHLCRRSQAKVHNSEPTELNELPPSNGHCMPKKLLSAIYGCHHLARHWCSQMSLVAAER